MKLLLTLALFTLSLSAQQPEAPKEPMDIATELKLANATVTALTEQIRLLQIQVQFYVQRDRTQAAEQALATAKAAAEKKPEPPTEKQ